MKQVKAVIVKASWTINSSSKGETRRNTGIYPPLLARIATAVPRLPLAATNTQTFLRKQARRRRTNLLLMGVSVVFFAAWAPIHIYLVMDILSPYQLLTPEDEESSLRVYSACHLAAMSTVCVNPLLYGWCNNNFKQSLFS